MQNTAADMAAHWKATGVERQSSYSRWVQYTQLRPGMDAKDWLKIWDSVMPRLLPTPTQERVTPTHEMKLRAGDMIYRIRIESQTDKVLRWTHEQGWTGSDPKAHIEWLRPLEENKL